MPSTALDDFVAVPLSTDIYRLLSSRYPDRVTTVIENVVTDFLERTEEEFAVATHSPGGIRWGKVFLPEGTQLRVYYKHGYKYAHVQGDQIEYEGQTVSSPSRLARRLRGNTSANAWKHIEVKRPGDSGWVLADSLRRGR